jgi:hypothetical protein
LPHVNFGNNYFPRCHEAVAEQNPA